MRKTTELERMALRAEEEPRSSQVEWEWVSGREREGEGGRRDGGKVTYRRGQR